MIVVCGKKLKNYFNFIHPVRHSGIPKLLGMNAKRGSKTNMSNGVKIGIDIGGHKINSVLMSGNRVIKKRRVATKSISNKKIMIAQIFDCIEILLNYAGKKQVKGIGIGAPVPVNVTALKNVSLAEIVQKKFKIKTKIENDANCFGFAEAMLGAGKEKKIIAGLTLGTGVGGFVIINGKIFHGKSPMATEFGHMTIKKNDRKCNCGRKGCLEAYISARGIMKTAQEIGLKNVSSPKDITKFANKDNKKAISVYKMTGDYLGIGLAKIIKIFKPEIIVIGGGISEAGKFIFEPVRKIVKNTKIVKAKLGENAGAIGAALLF